MKIHPDIIVIIVVDADDEFLFYLPSQHDNAFHYNYLNLQKSR